MQCNKCGSQNGQYKSGVRQKNGKPYRGFKCSILGEMSFMNTGGNGGQNYASRPQPIVHIDPVLAELREIKKMIAQFLESQAIGDQGQQNPNQEPQTDEEQPF